MAGKYWNETADLYPKYKALSDALIPQSGIAITVAGEALRCAANVYYDVYNNGGCNLGRKYGAKYHQLCGFYHFLCEAAFPPAYKVFDYLCQLGNESEEDMDNSDRLTEKYAGLLDSAMDAIVDWVSAQQVGA